MCMIITGYPICDVINLVINLSFLIKPFFSMTENSGQKIMYLKNEKSFYGEKNHFFIIFKGLSVARNCLRPESAFLIGCVNNNQKQQRFYFYQFLY